LADGGWIDAALAAGVRPMVNDSILLRFLEENDTVDSGPLIEAMRRDKKVLGGTPKFVVLNAVGTAETIDGVDIDLVAQTWRQLGAS
jgi:3-dehydroquinate synthetase